VIILAACEAAVALAIIISLFMNFGAIDTDVADRMKG
jgi:NADH:ubiquinone oxidoreductase subunit K